MAQLFYIPINKLNLQLKVYFHPHFLTSIPFNLIFLFNFAMSIKKFWLQKQRNCMEKCWKHETVIHLMSYNYIRMKHETIE